MMMMMNDQIEKLLISKEKKHWTRIALLFAYLISIPIRLLNQHDERLQYDMEMETRSEHCFDQISSPLASLLKWIVYEANHDTYRHLMIQ